MKNIESDNQVIDGCLCAFYETGLEGTLWSVQQGGVDGYDGLHPIEDRHILTVFNDLARSNILWEGEVQLEQDRDKQLEYLRESKYSLRLGPWGYGLPTNIHPFDWVDMFSQKKPAQLKIITP
jgi:hypothetical protein